MRANGTVLPLQERDEAEAIFPCIVGQGNAEYFGQRRHGVCVMNELMTYAAWLDDSRPANQEWNAMTSLVVGSLEFAKGTAGIMPLLLQFLDSDIRRAAVVTSEQDERVRLHTGRG